MMVDKEKLESYSKKYAEIKGNVVETSILKEKLVKQQEKSDNKLKKISNNISDEKSYMWIEISQKLHKKADKIKRHLKLNIAFDTVGGILLIGLGYFVIKLPIYLVVGVSSIITISQIISNIIRYKKDLNKCSITNIKSSDLINENISELVNEYSKELTKNKEINNTLNIVNGRLENLGELKLDIENLIICLFSSLDNIIKNKSNKQSPFYTWLNISYEDNEPKLEISDTLKRVRNKKEEK